MVNMSNHGDWVTRTAPGVARMVLFKLLGRSLGFVSIPALARLVALSYRRAGMLVVVPLMLLFTAGQPLSASQPDIIGPGCTTAFFIDKDCSGYGAGVKSSGNYPLSQGQPVGTPAWYTTGDKPDADDEDPTVNTTAQWQAKWGTDNAGMAHFLRTRKNFSNTRRIFYLSQTGSDSTARVGDPRRPFRSMAPILTALEDVEGGAVIIRGGIWTDLNFNPCRYNNGNPCFNLSGSEGHPVYVMAYPGERVQTNRGITSVTYQPFPHVCCVTIDGLIFRADRYGLDDGFSGSDTTSWTFINCEFAGWHQIIFGDHTVDALVKNSVFHDMMFHTIYFGFGGKGLSQGPRDFDFVLDEQRFRAGVSRGASYRGRIIGNVMYNNGASGYEPIHINAYIDSPVVEGNIVSFSGGSAFALQTGVYHALIRNNLFFDNGRDCGTLYLYDHGDPTIPATLRWNTIENNICYVGNPADDIRGTNPGGGIVQEDNTQTPGHYIKDTVIRNNIIVTYNQAPGRVKPAFEFGKNSYPKTDAIRDNIIWSSAPGAGSSERVMSISADAAPGGEGAGNYDFGGFQAFSPNLAGNQYADPEFKNASPALVMTPGAFKFDVPSTSAAVRQDSGAEKRETIGPDR